MAQFNNPWGVGNPDFERWYQDEPSYLLNTNAVNAEPVDGLDSITVESRADIIIVIDPGHGNTRGNTGASYIKSYKHKVKGDDGKPKKDEDGNTIVVETLVDNLPDYVAREVKKGKNAWSWTVKKISDHDKIERDLVWDVSVELKAVLTRAGYTAHLTRENKIINGDDNRRARNDFATKKKAHYFLSVHADGSYDYTKSGSHAIYRPNRKPDYDRRQKEFAQDVYRYYNVVTQHNSPDDRTDLQVISPSQNKSYRKTLLELGYVTNTSDWDNMSSNIELIAMQVAKGIEVNMAKVYHIYEGEEVVGYEFDGRVYSSLSDAKQKYRDYLQKEREFAVEHEIYGREVVWRSVKPPEPVYQKTRVKLKPIIE